MMGAKPRKVRSDLEKGQPEKKEKPKSKKRSEAYLKYQRYIRSKGWKEIRDEVFDERGRRCQICGRLEGEDGCTLSVHHNSYEHLYDERNHKEDLLVCCSLDHACIHRNKNNYKRFSLKEHDATDNN